MDHFCCLKSSFAKLVSTRSSCSTGKGKNPQGSIKYGFTLVKGRANHPMEDYHVAKFVQLQGKELGLFAIYDGHLGDSVPSYLQKHLFSNILKEDGFWEDPAASISKAYLSTDKAILSHSSDLGRGGSTAVTAILINGQLLWTANVGDSRAVLSRKGQAVQLTTDHEPNTERGIIENKGGFVSNIPGDVPRVNGQLAVSRAFGDKSLKSHLRSDPDVQSTDVDVDIDILILASDGLWKVMSNQVFDEVVEIVKSALEGEPKTPAEILLDEHLPVEENVLAALMTNSQQATGIPTSIMNELASRTNNVVDCPCIQSRIWEILIDHQHNPNLLKKALNLLEYLLINGSQEVLRDTRSPARASFLIELAAEYNKYEFEQYEFSQNLDVGAGVRKIAAEINTLLEDDDALFRARQKANKLHQSLSSRGLRSKYPSSPSHAGMHDELRPPAYSSFGSGDDDIASRIVTHPPSDSEDSGEENRRLYTS